MTARCVFPTCRNNRRGRHNIWCDFHAKRMQALADDGRRQRERDGGRGPEWWRVMQRRHGTPAVAAECDRILQTRQMPMDGVIRLFTVLQPWKDPA